MSELVGGSEIKGKCRQPIIAPWERGMRSTVAVLAAHAPTAQTLA